MCPADTNEPPRLLNFLTAPNALVWSAVAASAAFPGLFPAQNLLAKNAAGETVRWVLVLVTEACGVLVLLVLEDLCRAGALRVSASWDACATCSARE